MERREGEFCGEGGLRIWYQSWRPEAPRAIVVIAHGVGEHSGRYGNVVNCLVPKGYAVYALDHRGHGRSAGRRGHVNRFAEYIIDVGHLIDLARAEGPGLPVFLLGHSLGGEIALAHALERPEGVAGVIASSPGLGIKLQVPRLKVFLGELMSRLVPTFTQHSGLPANNMSHDPRVVQDYVGDPLVHDLVSARWYTEMTRTAREVMANARRLRLPLLVIQSDDDPLIDSQAVRRFFAEAGSADKTLREYAGFYHECFNEVECERPLADLVAWLDAHVPSPAQAGGVE